MKDGRCLFQKFRFLFSLFCFLFLLFLFHLRVIFIRFFPLPFILDMLQHRFKVKVDFSADKHNIHSEIEI